MDHQQAVLESYQERNFLKCLNLIDDCPVTKAKESPHYKLLRATCYVNLGIHVDLTHRILNELLLSNNNNEFAHYCKGLAFVSEKNYVAAIKCFDKAFDINPKTMMKAKELRDEAAKKLEPQVNEVSGGVEFSPEKKPNSKHSCPICHKTFASYSNLNRHKQLHPVEKTHRCTWCRLSFAEKSDLDTHVASTHEKADEVMETNQKPMEKIADAAPMEHDAFVHEPLPTIIPEQCESRDDKDVLKFLDDIDMRPFKCGECPKRFKQERTLRYHETLHQKEKLFECDFCGQTFGEKEQAHSHMESHKNLKQFSCNLCSFTFSNVKNYGEHVKKFHLKKN